MTISSVLKKPTKRRGALTVELAVVAPVLFIVIFGVIEIGRGIMVIHLLNNAAEVGCRTGIIEGQATDDIKTAVSGVLTPANITGHTTTVQVNGVIANASTAVVGNEITVTVTIPASSISWIPVPKYLSSKTLQGQYSLRRE
jgi:Flp pilus assembly protein TadG